MQRTEFCLLRDQMKRSKWIAAAWVVGFTIPALTATVFLIGCCMLPFHGVIHKIMPLCQIAAHVMRGEHGDDDHHHSAQTAPLPEKREPVKRVLKFLRPVGLAPTAAVLVSLSPATTPTAYRSFITLGAARCDDDVGNRLANLDTLRI
jgi:hypothetical protein